MYLLLISLLFLVSNILPYDRIFKANCANWFCKLDVWALAAGAAAYIVAAADYNLLAGVAQVGFVAAVAAVGGDYR